MTSFDTLLYEARDGVAWVTLNRPEKLNAFNERMLDEVEGLWGSIRDDRDVRAVVVSGAGDRAFCTGIDRDEAMGTPGAPPDRPAASTPFTFHDPGERLGPKSNDLWKPVIAAVNGIACGGAFYLLGEADIIVAAEEATFFDPHVTFGMASAYETIHMLQRMPFGEVARMQLLGSNERMSAARAHQIGLVSEVVPSDRLLEAAGWVAETIATQPPLAVEATLRALWSGLELPRRLALDSAYAYIRLGNAPDSIREGQAAFTSKERPSWRLR